MHNENGPSFLIVNADDYAYFPGVSRGIIDAHTEGIVTATGVLANGSSFSTDVEQLRSVSSLDTGVHLNLTFGRPLSAEMRSHFDGSSAKFASKAVFAKQYILGKISIDDIRAEWCAQIGKCLEEDLKLWFLNSHEHVHLFPSLFDLTQELAKEYDVPYVRLPSAKLFESMHPVGIVRAGIVKGLGAINKSKSLVPSPNFIGFGQSGHLSEAYVTRLIRGLQPGKIYELMCHPGYGHELGREFDHLLQYHDWRQEVETLTSPDIRAVCDEENVHIIGYREIENISNNGSLVVRAD